MKMLWDSPFFVRSFLLVTVSFLCAVLCVVGAPLSVQAVESEIEKGVSLDALIKIAKEKNQKLVSSAAQALRYNIRIPLVDGLTDPLLSFYYNEFPLGNMSKGFTSKENQEKSMKPVMSKLSSGRGKILTGRDMVENQALWYQYLNEDLILQVTSQIRQNFYKIYFLDKIIAVSEQNLSTLDSLIEISSASYAVGKVRQKDVLRTQIDRYQLQAEVIRLRQKRLTAVSQINYYAGRSAEHKVFPQISSELTSENLPEMNLSLSDFISGLYHKRPMIKGYQALGGRFKAMRGMVKMYFNREIQDEATYEADSGYREIKARGADFYQSVVSDMQSTLGDLKKNHSLSQLYGRVIVPQGRQSFEAGLADFRVGGEEYPVVLESLLALNKDQILYFQALSDYMVNMARLEELSGASLN